MTKLTITLVLCFLGYFLTAQSDSTQNKIACENCEKGFCWGTQPDLANYKYIQMVDWMATEEYEKAKNPADWLLENAPCLNKSLYINAEKIYKQLLRKSRGDEQLQDKILEILDARMKYFGEEALIKKKKGWRYYADRVNRGDSTLASKEPHWTEMYEFYKELIDSTESPHYAIVKYYFQSAAKMHKLKKLNDDELLIIFNESVEFCNRALLTADENYKPKWKKTQIDLNTTLINSIEIDCEFVKKNWIPKIQENPENIKLVKKAIRFMIQGKCTDEPEFTKLVELVYEADK
jgi:hypothetical protein